MTISFYLLQDDYIYICVCVERWREMHYDSTWVINFVRLYCICKMISVCSYICNYVYIYIYIYIYVYTYISHISIELIEYTIHWTHWIYSRFPHIFHFPAFSPARPLARRWPGIEVRFPGRRLHPPGGLPDPSLLTWEEFSDLPIFWWCFY